MVGGQIQPFGQNLAVAAGLIEQGNEVAVFQDVFDLRGGKQVFHILRGPGRDAAPLAKTLPDFSGIRRRLFLFQKQMELVGKIPGSLAHAAVGGDTAPNLILDNQHPQLFQLLAQILDVEAHKPVFNVHIGTVIKDIQATGHIQVKGLRHPVGLRDVLGGQGGVEVGKDGHFLRGGVCQVGPVDHLHGPVDHRLFDRLQTVLAAHHQLAERQHEVAFQRQRVFVLAVIQVDVQRIYIVLAGGGQLDNLPVKPLNKGKIFRLRVTDKNIVRGGEEHADDLGLAGHGLAAAGRTQL